MGFLRGYNATPDEEWFEQLARKRLSPEEAQEVLEHGNGWNRIMKFAELFSQEYFPLDDMYLQSRAESAMEGDWDEEDNLQDMPYALLRDGIPFELIGFIWEDIHELWDNIRPGTSAMVMLARAPHNTFSTLDPEEEGMRQAWLEASADHIPQETLEQIPQGGIPLEILEEALRETPLDAVCPSKPGGCTAAPTTSSSTAPSTMETFQGLLRPVGRRHNRGRTATVGRGQGRS